MSGISLGFTDVPWAGPGTAEWVGTYGVLIALLLSQWDPPTTKSNLTSGQRYVVSCTTAESHV